MSATQSLDGMQIFPLPLTFHTGCVCKSGDLLAGWHGSLHVSRDRGKSFSLMHEFPDEERINTTLVHEDSRGFIYFSARDKGRLHCSTDGGQTFSVVLDGIGGSIRGFSEDADGRLYAGGYSRQGPARLYVSDNGTSWKCTYEWDARHIHDVRVNLENGWLYVVVGEGTPKKTPFSHSVYRSMDRGLSFIRVVAPAHKNRPLFLPINFSGSTVILGTDHSEGGNYIALFEDTGADKLYTPDPIYHLPYDATQTTGHAFFTFIEKLGNSFFAGARGSRDAFLLHAQTPQQWRIVDAIDDPERFPQNAYLNASRSSLTALMVGGQPGSLISLNKTGLE